MVKPIILIDGSSYFFRAFHALPPLMTSKGQPTGAIYGVINMIKRLIKDYKPEKIAVIFDTKGKTFREELYPEYKAHREAMPDDLSSQFQPLVEFLEAMGIPILMIEGVEADDVIGTLAVEANAKGIPVIISTGDKDFAQLVNEKITLINTMSNKTLDIEGVKEKFGVTPNQIIDYLTLVGDSIDNIPGVQKCGPKTAAKWLNEFQTLDKLLESAHTITGKIGENLRASLGHLPLSRQLVTIKTDVSLPVALEDLILKEGDRTKLIEFNREFEFKTWLKELLEQEEKHNLENEIANAPAYSVAIAIINEEQQLKEWVTQLTSCKIFSINLKDNFDPFNPAIVGITLAIQPEKPIYIPLNHEDGKQLELALVLDTLKPILENPSIQKLGQNIKTTYALLRKHNINLQGIAYDTMLQSYLLNSNTGRHDLETLALKHLGHKTLEVTAKKISFQQIPINTAAAYASEEAHIPLRLHETLYPMLDEKLRKVLHEIEIPLISVIADMENHGVLIDQKTLFTHGERLKKRMVELEQEAVQLAGKPFNLNSPKQLQEILYGEQKLPVLAKTPTGQPSTAENILQELAYEYRLPAVILEYRSLSKLVSTYIDALPKSINPTTSRVHTSYNQAVTTTGRLSSSDPNLQNIPIRNEEGRLIRKAFIAPENHVLLAADYSQIELRIMAHLSKDPNLIKAFRAGWDIHTATASEIFGVELTAVTKEQRRRAKAVNFGLIYGMSAFGLAKQLGIERQEAQKYIDLYFERYPGVLKYMNDTRKFAHQHGYVETLFGRRLYLPEINTRNLARQRAAERMAINAPMQGTAADIIKKAMLAISEWQQQLPNQPVHMILQVHDELVFEVQQDAIELAKKKIPELMENVVHLDVPLVVDVGVGPNWDEAH